MRCCAQQRADGHWVFELEADATIPAEYVLLVHSSGRDGGRRTRTQRSASICAAFRPHHGGWSLVPWRRGFGHQRDGEGLFRAQDDRRRARCAAYGARTRGHPFARRCGQRPMCSRGWCCWPLYGETPWNRFTPTVPVELILLPRWFPIHLSKMSYWARTVIVPLLVLQALKPLRAEPARHSRAGIVYRCS